MQGDKVMALGITSGKRSPALPDVPPFAEARPAELCGRPAMSAS